MIVFLQIRNQVGNEESMNRAPTRMQAYVHRYWAQSLIQLSIQCAHISLYK